MIHVVVVPGLSKEELAQDEVISSRHSVALADCFLLQAMSYEGVGGFVFFPSDEL